MEAFHFNKSQIVVTTFTVYYYCLYL